MYVYVHAVACIARPQKSWLESILCFHWVDHGYRTQVVRLGSNSFCPRNHLTSLWIFLKIKVHSFSYIYFYANKCIFVAGYNLNKYENTAWLKLCFHYHKASPSCAVVTTVDQSAWWPGGMYGIGRSSHSSSTGLSPIMRSGNLVYSFHSVLHSFFS